MVINPKNRTLHYLRSAEGFMELQLPKLALDELAEIKEPGDFQVRCLWMTAEALKADGRFDEAVAPLQHVSRTLPAPMNEEALKSLSDCLEKAGRGSLPKQEPSRAVTIKIEPNQSVTIKFGWAS